MFRRVLILLVLAMPMPAIALEGHAVSPVSDVTVGASATLVKAANAFRATLSCTNTSTNVHVRWGDSTVTATKGQRLPATASIEITNTAAIYMISEGADVTVSCTEETR